MRRRPLPRLLLAPALLSLGLGPSARAADVLIAVSDPAVRHTHAPGEPFEVAVTITYAGSAVITAEWRDFEGTSLGAPVVLQPQSTSSLPAPRTEPGYLGLVLRADAPSVALQDRNPGQEREYGFVILPERTTADRPVDPEGRFGVVHAELEDPYLPGWVKTMTWDTTGSEWWLYEMDRRRDLGVLELPLVVGGAWESDDTRPISAEELAALEAQLAPYVAADPRVRWWELGLEENLSERWDQPSYWSNLAAKAELAKSIAEDVDPEIGLIFQVVDTEYFPGSAADELLSSAAVRSFRALALHPYRWPDFPEPDEWLPALVADTRAGIAARGLDLELWFTEIGAPHHGNPGGFFGYPESGAVVTGLSREREAAYLVKTHVLALQTGVEKIFWYNYVDQGPNLEYAEDHFGLIDFWGHPKAAYAAYFTMHSRIGARSPAGSRELPGGVRVHTMSDGPGSAESLVVAWLHPAARRMVPLAELGFTPGEVAEAVNTVGTPLDVSGGAVLLSANPVFLTIRDLPGAPDGGTGDAATRDGAGADAASAVPDGGPAPADASDAAGAPVGDASVGAPDAAGGAGATSGGCGCESGVAGRGDLLALLPMAAIAWARRPRRSRRSGV